MVRARLSKNVRPYSKNKIKAKRAGGVAQVVECLTSKRKALSSNPTISRKKKKKTGGTGGSCL
jgi:hypothetical protein